MTGGRGLGRHEWFGRGDRTCDGGYILEHTSWGWVFFINVPLCLLVAVGVFWWVPPRGIQPRGGSMGWERSCRCCRLAV